MAKMVSRSMPCRAGQWDPFALMILRTYKSWQESAGSGLNTHTPGHKRATAYLFASCTANHLFQGASHYFSPRVPTHALLDRTPETPTALLLLGTMVLPPQQP